MSRFWSEAFRAVGRKLLKTYLRGPHGLIDISHRIELEEDLFSWSTLGTSRTYFYRDDSRSKRIETILTKRRIMVSDPKGSISGASIQPGLTGLH